jgi:hypothetical protein
MSATEENLTIDLSQLSAALQQHFNNAIYFTPCRYSADFPGLSADMVVS